jgi:ferric-dicitrate binding protein FerR (iron transport regulator)
MSDRHQPTPSEATPSGVGGEADPVARDPIANLVRLAGARPPVPAERAARVEARVRQAWQAGVASRRRGRWVSWGAGLAAAAAVALAVGLTWSYVSRPAAPPAVVAVVERVAGSVTTVGASGAPVPLLAGARVSVGELLQTGDDGRVALRLASAEEIAGGAANGPSLRLDVGSRVRFVAAARLRLDAGAVYVDAPPAVPPDGGAPVLVETPFAEVTERGTQFEVRVSSGGVRVRVREGAVELARPAGVGGDRSWQAEAGAELTLSTGGRLTRGTVPAHDQAWAWVQEIAPSFELEGSTLGELLAWVGRETGWRVAWADPARAAAGTSVVLHGSVDGLPPEQALAAVLPTCGLAGRRDGESVVVFASSR